MLITNGEFTSFCDQGLAVTGHPVRFCRPNDSSIAPVHLRTLAPNVGAVKIVDSSFWGPATAVGELDGTGTVSFMGCRFESWDNHLNATATGFVQRGTPAIQLHGKALILIGNEFLQRGTQLSVGVAAKKAVMTGNVITGPTEVDHNGSAARIVVANNADDAK